MKTQRKVSKKVKTAPKLEYRIVVYPDFDYEVGAEEGSEFYDDEIQTLEQYGAWGYVVESRKIEQCDTCAKTYDWELVDSCAGFLGDNTDYMHREAMANVPVGHGDVEVYEQADGRYALHHINTWSK